MAARFGLWPWHWLRRELRTRQQTDACGQCYTLDHVDALVLGVFALVYVGMILGELPGLRTDRTGIALLGAIVLIASDRMTADTAWGAVHAAVAVDAGEVRAGDVGGGGSAVVAGCWFVGFVDVGLFLACVLSCCFLACALS